MRVAKMLCTIPFIMRFHSTVLIALLTYVGCYGQSIEETLKQKALNNQDPAKWNMELFESDKSEPFDFNGPMALAAYPVESYKFSVASSEIKFKIGQHHFTGISFGENVPDEKGNYTPEYQTNLIFYTGSAYLPISSLINSRNAPYLTFQGAVGESNFIGLNSPDGKGFVFVNMKLFDLRFGETIIIFQNGKEWFYYLQTDDKLESAVQKDLFIEKIKKNSNVLELVERIGE